jgi:hypothetical protein
MFNTFITSEADQNNNLGAFNGPISTSVRNNNLLYVGGGFFGVAGYKSAPLTVFDYTGSGIQISENPIEFKLDQFHHGNGVYFNDIVKLDDNSYVCCITQVRSNNQYYFSSPANGLPVTINNRLRYGHYVNITTSGLNTGWALGMGGGKDGKTILMLNSRTGWLFGGGNNIGTFFPPSSSENPGSRTTNRIALAKDTRNAMGYYLTQTDSTCNLSRTVSNAPKEPFFVTGSFYPSGGTGIVMYNNNFSTNDGKTLGGISAHEIISGFAITGLQSCNGGVVHAKLDPVRKAIYFIGYFTTVNGVTRNRAAACDLNFNLLPWNPNIANNLFGQLELGKSGIYILGGSTPMNPQGSGDPYNWLAKFDYDSGNLISQFAPDRGGSPSLCGYNGKMIKEFGDGKFLLIEAGGGINNNIVNANYGWPNISTDIALSGRKLYGYTNIIDTISGKYLYGTLDHYRGGVLGSTNQSIKRIIDNKLFFTHTSPCSSSNNKIFKERSNTACIDLNTNSITDWAPEIYHPNCNIALVNTMYLDTGSNSMFLGGTFDWANSQVRAGIASVDLISGKTTSSFNPNLDYYNSDRAVTCIEKSGNIVYIGGQFQKNGDINTRFFVGVNTGTNTIVEGLNWQIQDFPDPINKEGYARGYLSSSLVSTMKRKDNLLYVGGRFTQVSGLSRSGLFCYDIQKKQITDLNIPFDDVIYNLDIDDANNILYAVGRFHTVSGLPRPRGAAINLTTSGITNWNPAFSRHPLQVRVHPSGIIVGGTFADLGTGKAYTLTAFDFNTTEMQRYPRSTMMNDLYCMDIYNGKLYIGGSTLAQNDTLPLDRACIAYELNNGRLYTGWAPNPNSTVQSMHIHQDSGLLFIGGYFTNVRNSPPPSTATTTRNYIAGWDVKTQPHTFLTSFDPNLNGGCLAFASSGNMLYMGGSFTTVSGITRNRIAAWNLSTNTLDPNFNPNIGNNSVLCMKISGSHMYVGGDFTLVSGVTRNRCAKIRLSDGALDTSFNPNFNSTVRAIDISGDYLYAGGNFSTVGVTSKLRMCAVNVSNGAVYSNFTAIPNFSVNKSYYSDPSSYLFNNFTLQSYDYVEDVKVYPGTGVGFCGHHWELYQNSGNRGVHFVNATGGQLIKTFGGYAGSVWEAQDNVGGGQTVQGRAGEEFMVYDNKLYVVNRYTRDCGYENMNRLTNKNTFLTITNKTNGDPICDKNFTLNTNIENFYGRGFGGETQWMRQYINGANYSGDNIYFYGDFLDTYPEERIAIGKMGIDGVLKKDFKLFSI